MPLFRDEYARIGYLSSAASLEQIVSKAITQSSYIVGIKSGASRQVLRRYVDDDDVADALKLAKRFPVHIFRVLPNTFNLCGSSTTAAWLGNEAQDVKARSLVTEIDAEREVVARFGCGGGVVLEAGLHHQREVGVKACIKTLRKLGDVKDARVFLETGCASNSIAKSLPELKEIIDATTGSLALGVCLNLKHLHIAGHVDPDRPVDLLDQYAELFDGGADRVVVRVNDYDHRSIQHESKRVGFSMWKDRDDALVDLVRTCQTRRIPMLCDFEEDAGLLWQMIA
jgi:hypothetical protein